MLKCKFYDKFILFFLNINRRIILRHLTLVEVYYKVADTSIVTEFAYVNDIPTTEGGTHETGFKSALTKALNDFGRASTIKSSLNSGFLPEQFAILPIRADAVILLIFLATLFALKPALSRL